MKTLNTADITIINHRQELLNRGWRVAKYRTRHTLQLFHDVLNHENPQPTDRRLIVTLEYWTKSTAKGPRPATEEQCTLSRRILTDYRHDRDRATGGSWTHDGPEHTADITHTQAATLCAQVEALIAEQFHAPHAAGHYYRRPGYFPDQALDLPTMSGTDL